MNLCWTLSQTCICSAKCHPQRQQRKFFSGICPQQHGPVMDQLSFFAARCSRQQYDRLFPMLLMLKR